MRFKADRLAETFQAIQDLRTYLATCVGGISSSPSSLPAAGGFSSSSLLFFVVVLLHTFFCEESTAEQIVEKLEAASRQHVHAHIQGRTFRHEPNEHLADVDAAAEGVGCSAR
jgi:hypothetical protein